MSTGRQMSDAVFFDELQDARLTKLVAELRHACAGTKGDVLLLWGGDTAQDYVGLGTHRISKAGRLAARCASALTELTAQGYTGYQDQRVQEIAKDTGENAGNTIESWAGTGKDSLAGLISELRYNPIEAAPRLLTTVLVSLPVSSGPDDNGGIPDLDIACAGIEAHRSVRSHSVITGAILDTFVLAVIRLVHLVHDKLPPDHDPWWDTTRRQADGIPPQGVRPGLACHPKAGSSVQPAAAAYTDLPLEAMPLPVPLALFTANGGAEVLDAVSPEARTGRIDAPSARTPGKRLDWPFARLFNNTGIASAFCNHVQKNYDATAKLQVEKGRILVSYRPADGVPVTDYRRGQPYSSKEAGFLRRHYLLWACLPGLAQAVDRPQAEVEAWLVKEGLRTPAIEVPADMRRVAETFRPIAYEIYRDEYSEEGIGILKKSGIISADQAQQHTKGKALHLRDIEPDMLDCLRTIMVLNGHHAVAARISNHMGQFKQAFILARQADCMEQGVPALLKSKEMSSVLPEASEAGLSYLRIQVIEQMCEYLAERVQHLAAWRGGESITEFNGEWLDERFVLADRLYAAMNARLENWPPLLRVLYQTLRCNKPDTGDDLELNRFGMWMFADFAHYSVDKEAIDAYIKHEIDRFLDEYVLDVDSLHYTMVEAMPVVQEDSELVVESHIGSISGQLAFVPDSFITRAS